MKQIKNSQNNIAAGVPEMKYPLQMDSAKLNFGSKTKLRKEKVVMRDSKTGEIFGSRVVYQKTTESCIIKELLEADTTPMDSPQELSPDEALPDVVVSQLKSNIRKGAKDLQQKWASALELTQKSYEVSSVKRPSPINRDQWKQYERLIQFAVRQLFATRGANGTWRMTSITSI